MRSASSDALASADAPASAACTPACRAFIASPARRAMSTAGGKARQLTAHSCGEIDTIMPTHPPTIATPRTANTPCVVTSFCSANVGAKPTAAAAGSVCVCVCLCVAYAFACPSRTHLCVGPHT